MLKFDTKNAIALSNFSIFFSSALRYLLNSGKPHPLKNGKGKIVDLNIGILMMPMVISGVSFGVILNIVTPGMIVIISYVVFLALVLGFGLVKKAFVLRKKETLLFEQKKLKEKEIELRALSPITDSETNKICET